MRRELGKLILHELVDPRLDGAMPSVTRISVAEDLSTADVYVTAMGPDVKQQLALGALRSAAAHLRGRLMKEMVIRLVPVLKFHLDDKLRKELEVMNLLELARKDVEEADARRAAKAAAEAGESPATDDSPAAEESPDAEPVAADVALAAGATDEAEGRADA